MVMKALQQVIELSKKIDLRIRNIEDKIDRKITPEIEGNNWEGLPLKDVTEFQAFEKKLLSDPQTFDAVVNSKFFSKGSQCSYRLCCGSVLPLTMANSVTLGELFFIACLVEVYNFFSTLKSFLTSPWACKNALKMSHECTHAIPAMLDLRFRCLSPEYSVNLTLL